MFTIHMRRETNRDNGCVRVGESYYSVVPANTPLGGGTQGWYAVCPINFDSREDAAKKLGEAIWWDGDLPDFDVEAEGEAILQTNGY